jgi:ATP-dependent DNA helicase RecG
MTRDDVEAWVRQGESELQEFKQTSGQRTEGARTVCAMLNNRGGRVLFGVSPQGKVIGQQVTDKTISDIVCELQLIEPPALPTVERVTVAPDKQVIAVEVAQGQRRPYSFKGKGYQRVGTNTLEMPRDEYHRLLLEQLHATARWENEPAAGWKVQDLDTTEIVRTLDESIRRGRSEDPGTRSISHILRGLGLLKNAQLLRAAVVLFAKSKRLLPDYPQCLLRLARFRGTDRTEFLDNKQFHGNVFSLLIRAERFLREHLPVAGRVVPNLFERVDDPLYPPLALREGLANALSHRDYSIGGGSVAVGIYDDRLEITSSGTLHFGLKVEDLFRPHESLPWNPLIAGVLYRRGIIESWGRGTLKMAELTDQAGLPRPEIEESGGCVIVRFRPGQYVPPQRIGLTLSKQQQAILQILGRTESVAFRDIVAGLGKRAPIWSVKEDLTHLKRLGLIESRGYARGAKWVLRGKQA